MARVRVAIDGCGTLTTDTILGHLAQPDFLARAEVVAVCDIVPGRAENAARVVGDGTAWFGDYAQMLREADFDAVFIIVPHHLHADHALQAVRAGRHVYVQKPMAPTVAAGRELVEEARRLGRKVVAAPGQALWPMYHQIRDIIEQGEIGRPYVAVPPLMGWGCEDVGFPTDPSWFFGADAGPFRDHGGYGFQTLVSILGPALRVSAFSGTPTPWRRWNGEKFDVTGHDNTAALIEFAGSVFGLLPEAWCDTAPGARFLRIHGLNGAIQTDPETFNYLDILPIGALVQRIGKEPLRLEVKFEDVPMTQGKHPHLGHTHVYGDMLHLVECIQDDLEPIANGERGLHFVELIENAFRSAADGRAMAMQTSVEPHPESSPDA